MSMEMFMYWILWGINFAPGIFFIGFFGSSRDFFGFDFCPHLIIPGTVILPFFFLIFGRTLFISCTI